jgi:hypothetical protein
MSSFLRVRNLRLGPPRVLTKFASPLYAERRYTEGYYKQKATREVVNRQNKANSSKTIKVLTDAF